MPEVQCQERGISTKIESNEDDDSTKSSLTRESSRESSGASASLSSWETFKRVMKALTWTAVIVSGGAAAVNVYLKSRPTPPAALATTPPVASGYRPDSNDFERLFLKERVKNEILLDILDAKTDGSAAAAPPAVTETSKRVVLRDEADAFADLVVSWATAYERAITSGAESDILEYIDRYASDAVITKATVDQTIGAVSETRLTRSGLHLWMRGLARKWSASDVAIELATCKRQGEFMSCLIKIRYANWNAYQRYGDCGVKELRFQAGGDRLIVHEAMVTDGLCSAN